MSIEQAIAYLGVEHIEYCLKHPGRFKVLRAGAWIANNLEALSAYNALAKLCGVK